MTDDVSHASRYFGGYARDPLAREAARRYRRDHGIIRANLVEHCEERPLDDPRRREIRILLASSVIRTTDPDLALALIRATRRNP